MRQIGLAVVSTTIFAGLVGVMPTAWGAADPPDIAIAQQIAVPSYVHPGADPQAWDAMIGADPGTVGVLVANPLNGPDYQPMTSWGAVMQRAHNAGIRVLGYVSTGYLGVTTPGLTNRLGSTATEDWLSQIQRDVTAWYDFYGSAVDGIFFDEMHNRCGPGTSNEWADIYRMLNDWLKREHPGAFTVGNPGTGPAPCYEDAFDVLLTFEGSYGAYSGNPPTGEPAYTPMSWTPSDPRKIWHLVYNAPNRQAMESAVKLSKERGAGWTYVTDDVLANPWDSIPMAYWDNEQDATAPGGSPGTVPPSVPNNLSASMVDARSVTVAWPVSTGVSAQPTGYDVYRDGVWIGAAGATDPSFTDRSVSSSTTYGYQVAARDRAANVSALSAVLQVTTDPTTSASPTAPSLLEEHTEHTSTSLTWTASTDTDDAVVAYEVVQDGKPVITLSASMTSLTVGGLLPAGSYSFNVQALDASGNRSARSNAIAVSTPPTPEGNTVADPSSSISGSTISYTATFYVPFAFRHVFIRTDETSNPCWQTASSRQLCADYMLENNKLLKYAGGGTDFTWTPITDVVPTMDGYTYTWDVDLADLGQPTLQSWVFNGNGYAPSAYTSTCLVESVRLAWWLPRYWSPQICG